jgi:hypothetical protein
VDTAISNIPAVDLTGLATEDYVDQAVGGIDLTGLATEDYVDQAVGGIDLTGLATEDYVDTAIGNIEIPDDQDVLGFVSTNLVKFNRTIDTFAFPEGPFGLGSIAIYDFATQGAVWVHNGGTDAPYTPNFVNLPVIAETTVVCTLVFLAPVALPLTNVLIEGNEIEGVMRGLGGDNPIADGVSDYIVSYTFIRGTASWLRVFVSVTQFSETSPTPPPEPPPPE